MTAPEPVGAWGTRLSELLRGAAELPPGAGRVEAAGRVVTSMLLGRSDDVAVAAIKAEAARYHLLTKTEVNGIVRDMRRRAVLADPDHLAESADAPAPPHEINVPSGQWRYAEGDQAPDQLAAPCAECAALGHPRGVYYRQREGDPWRRLAVLPWCHARIVRRGASGDRAGLSYLLSAEPDSPPLILGHLKIKDGTWANELGVPLSDDRKVIDAAATAIRYAAEQAPEREAVARVTPSGSVAIPPPQCLPAGYLATAPGITRAEALSVWGDIAREAARNAALADALGASASAHMLKALGVQGHWLDAYGDSDRGKSTMLRLCAGVWGDPSDDGSGTFQTWNTTGVGMGRFLGELGLLPAFMDEGGMSGFKPVQWGELIYRTTGGASRQGAERKGESTTHSLPWHGILFITGNGRVTNGITTGIWAGIPKRVNESPAPFTNDAAMAETLDALIAKCYGHLACEILDRFTVADFREIFDASAAVIETPEGGVPRTWARQLRLHYAGAVVIDRLCATGGVLAEAQAAYAAAYLAENCREPEHDADILLAALAEAQAREPSRWPTIAEYRANRSARDYGTGGAVASIANHGVDKSIAGVRHDDGDWFAVFPGLLGEVVDRLALDQSRALRELHSRGVLLVPEAARRRGDFLALVRLMPKPASATRMYKLAPPEADADADADADQAPPEAPENYADVVPRVHEIPPPEPVTPVTPQVRGPKVPVTSPVTPPVTPPVTRPSEVPEYVAEAAPEAADMPPGEVGACAKCGAPTRRYGPHGRPFCDACSPSPRRPEGAPRPASRGGNQAGPEALAPTRPPRRARADQAGAPNRAQGREAAPSIVAPSPLPFLVLGGDGRAFGPDGLVVEVPELGDLVAACGHVGDLAGLALGLGVLRLYVPRIVREALGLPASLAAGLRDREGVPHQFTDAAPPEQWDIWPNQPVGLAPWLTVYRVPRSGDGVHVVFAEYLAAEGSASLGDLPPDLLAEALTLIWRASTYTGNGGVYGGVHFHRSGASTFKRLMDVSARRSRDGEPEAAELPPPFTAKPVKGAPMLGRPQRVYSAPAEVPPGWVVAALDVRKCYASAARSTPIGYGAPRKIRPGEVGKLPGIHLLRVSADRAEVAPGVARWFPLPRARQREVGAWLDTAAAAWVIEVLGADVVRVDQSWVYDDSRRIFDSPIARMIEAGGRLGADPSPAAQAAAAVVKAGPNRYLGGWLASTFGGKRAADDWHQNQHASLAVASQAEVRKQRNLVPMIGAGVRVLGGSAIDHVYVAAPSAEALINAPGTGGRPAIVEVRPWVRGAPSIAAPSGAGAGKFRIEQLGEVTPELSAALADQRAHHQARLSAIREALGDQGAELGGIEDD